MSCVVVSIKFPNVSVCKVVLQKQTLKESGLIYLYLISGWYLTNQVTVRHERLFIQLAINELCSGQSTSTIGLRFCCGNMSPIVLGIKKHLHHRLIAHCKFWSIMGYAKRKYVKICFHGDWKEVLNRGDLRN